MNYLGVNHMKEAVLQTIKRADFYEPVTQYEIARQCGIEPRTVRRVIRELREEGNPILSTPQKPGGYYLAETRHAGAMWYKQIRRKALKELLIARIVMNSCEKLDQNGLFEGGKEND